MVYGTARNVCTRPVQRQVLQLVAPRVEATALTHTDHRSSSGAQAGVPGVHWAGSTVQGLHLGESGQGLTSTGLLDAHHIADLQGELGGSVALEVVYGCEKEEGDSQVRPGVPGLCSLLLSLPEAMHTWDKQNQCSTQSLPQQRIQTLLAPRAPLTP